MWKERDGGGKTLTGITPGIKAYELLEELAKYLTDGQKDMFI